MMAPSDFPGGGGGPDSYLPLWIRASSLFWPHSETPYIRFYMLSWMFKSSLGECFPVESRDVHFYMLS